MASIQEMLVHKRNEQDAQGMHWKWWANWRTRKVASSFFCLRVLLTRPSYSLRRRCTLLVSACSSLSVSIDREFCCKYCKQRKQRWTSKGYSLINVKLSIAPLHAHPNVNPPPYQPENTNSHHSNSLVLYKHSAEIDNEQIQAWVNLFELDDSIA